MHSVKPTQILLDGTVEQTEPESMLARIARFSTTSAEEHGLVNMTQAGLILGRSKQLV